METMYEIFKRSPKEALEAEFARREKRCPWEPGCIFVWQSRAGHDTATRYGSYRTITRAELERRQYEIEFWDGQVSIFWLDEVHNTRTHKNELKVA